MALTINEKNAHPRDLLIEFDPIPHKYTCKGDANYMSVTTWLHSHFKQFDADAVIAKMMSNPKNMMSMMKQMKGGGMPGM